MKTAGIIALALATAGCATTGTEGVQQIGPDLYMLGGLGKMTDWSGSAVKARYFREASDFCTSKGQTMQPVSSTGKDAGWEYASAEVQFRCLAKNDPGLPR